MYARTCLTPLSQHWSYQNTSVGSSISELHAYKVIILLTGLLLPEFLKMTVSLEVIKRSVVIREKYHWLQHSKTLIE